MAGQLPPDLMEQLPDLQLFVIAFNPGEHPSGKKRKLYLIGFLVQMHMHSILIQTCYITPITCPPKWLSLPGPEAGQSKQQPWVTCRYSLQYLAG